MNNPHHLPPPPFAFTDLPGWYYAGFITRDQGAESFAAEVEKWNTPEDQQAEVYADGAVLWKKPDSHPDATALARVINQDRE